RSRRTHSRGPRAESSRFRGRSAPAGARVSGCGTSSSSASRAVHSHRGNAGRRLAVVPVQLVRGRILHDAGHLGEEVLSVAGATQEVEAHFHAGGDPPPGHDPPRIPDTHPAHLAPPPPPTPPA